MASVGLVFDLLRLTIDEAWAVRDFVRRGQDYGTEWDRDFMRRVHTAILDAKNNPGHDVALMVTEEELWQMDRQIPPTLMIGTQAVGRNLLLKVMALLRKFAQEVDDDPDTGEDAARNNADPAEADDARRSLSSPEVPGPGAD